MSEVCSFMTTTTQLKLLRRKTEKTEGYSKFFSVFWVAKTMTRWRLGNQKPKTSNGLTAKEISYLFTYKCSGAHHPRALVNALKIYVTLMGRWGMTELQKVRLSDLFVSNSNGQLFLNMLRIARVQIHRISSV